MTTTKQSILSKLEISRKELLDLGLRNNLLNYRPLRSRGLSIVDELPDEIFRILVRNGKAMSFVPVPEKPKESSTNPIVTVEDEAQYLSQPEEVETGKPAARHTDLRLQTTLKSVDLQSRLIKTFYFARTSIEEQGVNILYLALGMLNWYESDSAQEPRQAPLILIPVMLDRSSALERFQLKYTGDDIGDNLSLAAKLDSDFHLTLPPIPAFEDLEVIPYFEAVENHIRSMPRWTVNRNAIALGFFSYAKFLMYKDLDISTWPADKSPLDHPILNAVLGKGFREPDSPVSEFDQLDSYLEPAQVHHVLDADSSQALAILDVTHGRNLVVQGPPGTGKSQTITNIIAEAIGAGKTVLFVSEKMAALEVVKRRLDAIGLGDACLELHSHKARKKDVLAELGRTLLLARPGQLHEGKAAVDSLRQARDRLNEYCEAINVPIEPSGITPYRAYGDLINLQEKHPDLKFPRLVCEAMPSWTDADFALRLALTQELQFRLFEVGIPKDHPFWGTKRSMLLPTEQHRLHEVLAEAQRTFYSFRDAASHLASSLQLPPPQTPEQAYLNGIVAKRILTVPDLSGASIISSEWTARRRDVENLLAAGAQYTRLRADFDTTFVKDFWPQEFRRGKWQDARTGVINVRDAASRVARLSNQEPPTQRSGAVLLATVARRLLDMPDLTGIDARSNLWLTRAPDLQMLIASGIRLAELYNAFIQTFAPDAWNVAPEELENLKQTLETYGTKWWKLLSGRYRAARNRFIALHQPAAQHTPPQDLAQQIAQIQVLQEAQYHYAVLSQHASLAASLFGTTWHNTASHWTHLTQVSHWLHRLHKDIEERESPSETLDFIASNPSVRIKRRDVDELDAALTSHGTSLHYLSEICPDVPPPNFAAQQLLFDVIGEIRSHQQTLHDFSDLGASLFGDHWKGEHSQWSQLQVLAQELHVLHEEVANGELPQVVIDYLASNPSLRASVDEINRFEHASSRHRSAASAAVEFIQLDQDLLFGSGSTLLRQSLDEQERLLTNWATRYGELHSIVSLNALVDECRQHDLAPVVDAALSWPEASEHLATAFHMTWLEQLLDIAYKERRSLAWFDGESHHLTVRKFRELDSLTLRHNRARLALKHWSQIPRDSRDLRDPNRVPMAVVRREIEKKSRHKPLRQLMLLAGPAIQTIKPVFMMGPLSIANFLAPESVKFDLIIFDEASQVKPVDAFGALLRGNQAVVVGDSKQLPPSSFFESAMSSDSLEEESATGDLESILGLFVSNGAPERMLRWHYRSRHESLIAVSNRAFYDNRLVIFPSPDAKREELGLRLNHLPDTTYDRGHSRVNIEEARAVAQAVMVHAETHPELTLGVAAFSISQMQAIVDQLEVLRRHYPAYETFFAAHPHEPFFIKNLENVQGDERDVIFISIGYGRSAEGQIAMDFGPLNRDGGERRLNVLITRARRRCEVFTNLTADDINLERTKSRGARALKTFLSYARSGHMDVPGVSGKEPDSPFEEAVLHHLTNAGYAVHPQVGSAGYFIDLAVVDPARPGRYLLGIECDGATYHSARSARDRDRLRQQILEGLGWRIHRIWSTDWFRNPQREAQRVIEAIEQARKQSIGSTMLPSRVSDFSVLDWQPDAVPPTYMPEITIHSESHVGRPAESPKNTEAFVIELATVADDTIPQTIVQGVRLILSDGLPRTARELATELAKRGIETNKMIINQVLTREGRGHFLYDSSSYMYSLANSALRGSSARRPDAIDTPLTASRPVERPQKAISQPTLAATSSSLRIIHAPPPYQLARLTVRSGLNFKLNTYIIIRNWLLDVVNIESPVHIDEVIARIAQAAGEHAPADLRDILRREIEKAHSALDLQKVGDFLWRPDMRKPIVRDRSSSELPASLRLLIHVPQEELKLAVEKAITDSFGLTRDQVPSAALGLLGITDLNSTNVQVVLQSVEFLLTTKRIQERRGQLVPPLNT